MTTTLPRQREQPSRHHSGAERDNARRRILIAGDTYPPDVNGASYFTYRLAAGLAARGHDVHVVCPSDTGRPEVTVDAGVTLHRLRSASLLVHPTFRATIPAGLTGHIDRLIQRLNPDVAHVQSHFTTSRVTAHRARLAGVPVVLTNHFMPENLLSYGQVPPTLQRPVSELAWRDQLRVARKADHVTVPTRRAGDILTRRGFDHPVEAVSCGIDLSRFRPRPAEQAAARAHFDLPDRDTMAFVGRLDDEKHLPELVRALPRVLEQRDAQLAVVGTGKQEDELRALAVELGVASRTHFLGFVSDDDLPLAYVAADAFAIASIAELQSIATLEAMSTGLPVVAAEALALPHLVDPGGNGYLYPPGDVDALASSLLAVLESHENRERMGAASRAIAQEHDHHRSLERFEGIYTKVDTGAPGQPIGRREADAHAPGRFGVTVPMRRGRPPAAAR